MSRPCPICREEAPLRVIQLNGVTVETCDRCQGHWLDSLELERLAPGWRTESLKAALPHAPRRCPHARHRVPAHKMLCGLCGAGVAGCPSCGQFLSQVETKVCAVDVCATCQGIWLDAGELQALRRHKQTITPLTASAAMAAAAAVAVASAAGAAPGPNDRASRVLQAVTDNAGEVAVEGVDVALEVSELAPMEAISEGVSSAAEVAVEGASAVGEAIGAVLGSVLELFS